jgi:hypothetical protein
MPFGKHRGEDLDDVPDDYLCWVLDNCTNITPTLRRAIEERLGLAQPKPSANGAARAPPPEWVPPPPGIDRDALDRAVKAWFRRLAMKHHPDRGGSHEAMKALNEAHQQLLDFLDDLKR